MTDARHYDTIDFHEYLDGNASTSVTLWTDTPVSVATAVLPRDGNKSASKKSAALKSSPELAVMRCDALTRRHLGARAVAVDYPGGRGREAWRVHLEGGQSVIVTRREVPARAILEANVLTRLHASGAPVPKLLAFNGLVLIQEDVGRTRVSDRLLRRCGAADYTSTMADLIDSLWQVYEAADRTMLVSHVPVIGRSDDWVTAFVDRTALVGNNVKIACPRPDIERLQGLFRVLEPEFVKWDARSANAHRMDDGAIRWIDWEHCGGRHRLDDLAWLLADDGNPDFAAEEMALIERFLPRYANGALDALSREYLFAFGACHMAVRLARILTNKGDARWDDEAEINGKDLERVRLSEAVGLCRRAERWCREARPMRKLAPWFNEVAAQLQTDAASQTRA